MSNNSGTRSHTDVKLDWQNTSTVLATCYNMLCHAQFMNVKTNNDDGSNHCVHAYQLHARKNK